MRSLFTPLLFSIFICAPAALASTPASVPAANHPLSDSQSARLLSSVDSSYPIDRSAEVPQTVSVEAVPTPTAVASGSMVLGGLALLRLYRRFRYV